MRLTKTLGRKSVAVLMAVLMLLSVMSAFSFTASAAGATITYTFTGSDKDTAGYAEGTITVSASTAGTYSLYWASDTSALSGYYPIASLNVSAGGSAQFKFGNHTAIPFGATKIIATATADKTVANAAGVYTLPTSKRLAAGKLLYRFNSYSDVHIADDNWYKNCDKNWKQALKFGVDKKTDFIVSSGDMISFGREAEWERYERILADSNYVNPVYESNGNHDLRDNVSKGNTTFVRASGTDNTIANYDANKPYYYVTEKTTGDIFIFMALETNTNPSAGDEFSSAQMTWLTNLLAANYGKGKNIYLIEHAPINGFGAGDRMSNPYYKAHLSESYPSTVQFKALLKKYPKLIWMSGHTHQDFSLGYNYSNENGTACNMIHNPAVAGSTKANASDDGQDYNDGYGFNSQGYYVEAFEEQIIYYGSNLTDELIYPEYSYIMSGARKATQQETNPTDVVVTVPTTEATGATVPAGVDTKCYFFKNTLNWSNLTCYSWSDSDVTTCKWPGYKATYYGKDASGSDVYYCKVPASHTCIIWNNGDNGYQTADIELDGVNNMFTPASTTSSKKTPVTASVTDLVPPTDPVTPTTPGAYSMGDVNFDGDIDIKDATQVQRYAAMIVTFTAQQKALADVNGDGDVDIKDATLIQRYAAMIITSFPVNASAKLQTVKTSDTLTGAGTLAQTLTEAKNNLDALYAFASYDQYQAVKKLYYQYNGQTTADATVIAQFDAAIAALTEITSHIGAPVVTPVGDTYYFENTYNWANVKCYAWNGSANNGEWPGAAVQKVGTNQGHDVYGIKFNSAGQYKNLIFNDGVDGGEQTEDIILSSQEGNCFYLDGGKDSSGHYTVKSFNYSGGTAPTAPPTTTQQVGSNNHYALCYYNGTAHGWGAIDTFFTPNANGTYVLNLVTKNADDISLNVYDNAKGVYNCVAESTNFTYSGGLSKDYILAGSSSRGKSVTIKGLSAGLQLSFVYNPTANTLKVTCGATAQDPVENPATNPPATGATYNFYMAPTASDVNSGYTFFMNIKDSSEEYHLYQFVKTDKTYGGVPVYKVTVTDATYTNVIKVQYQTRDASGTTDGFKGQVVDERATTLSYYNNKIMVCTSTKLGSLAAYTG